MQFPDIERPTDGWFNCDGQSRKWHFFAHNRGGERSLCGRWTLLFSIRLDPGLWDAKDNCADCFRNVRREGFMKKPGKETTE